ncbi:hypothetical protein OSTOST_07769, partial [Ostertagia ostertagi]
LSHFTYEGHGCKNAYKKNVQVPTCPLCDKPVPTPKGVSPDVQTSISKNNLWPARSEKKNLREQMHCEKGVKRRSLFPSRVLLAIIKIIALAIVTRRITIVNKPEAVLLFQRLLRLLSQETREDKIVLQISEDEALARALAESMDEVSISPEERDRRLAEQLQAQEYGNNPVGQRNTRAVSGNTNSCSIS